MGETVGGGGGSVPKTTGGGYAKAASSSMRDSEKFAKGIAQFVKSPSMGKMGTILGEAVGGVMGGIVVGAVVTGAAKITKAIWELSEVNRGILKFAKEAIGGLGDAIAGGLVYLLYKAGFFTTWQERVGSLAEDDWEDPDKKGPQINWSKFTWAKDIADGISGLWNDLWESFVRDVSQPMWGVLDDIKGGIIDFVVGVPGMIKDAWDLIGITELFDDFGTRKWFENIYEKYIYPVFDGVIDITKMFGVDWGELNRYFTDLTKDIGLDLKVVGKISRFELPSIEDIEHDLWNLMGALRNIATNFWDLMKEGVDKLGDWIKDAYEKYNPF